MHAIQPVRQAPIVPVILLSLLLVACGDDDPADGPPPSADDGSGADMPVTEPDPDADSQAGYATPETLPGRWESDCSFADGGAYGAASITFAGAESSTGSAVFDDPGCSRRLLELEIPSGMLLGDALVLEDGAEATELDIVIGEQILIILRDPTLVSLAKVERFCGRDDWTRDTSYDVTDCGFAAPLGSVLGATLMQAVALESGALYLGDAVSAPGGDVLLDRVTRLDRDRPYTLVSR